tara:strand:+ start:75 stop:761 length:687 start_codon:yes stop_codon:yes gene_type:complete
MYTILVLLFIISILLYLLKISKNYYNYETFYASNCNNKKINKAILVISKDICDMEKKISRKRAANLRYVKMYNWYLNQIKVPDLTKLSSRQLNKDKALAAKYISTDGKPEKLRKSKSEEEAKVKEIITKNINSQNNQLSDEQVRMKWVKLKTDEELGEKYDASKLKHRITRNKIKRISMQLTKKQMQIQIKNMEKRSFSQGVDKMKTGSLEDAPDTGKMPDKAKNAIS